MVKYFNKKFIIKISSNEQIKSLSAIDFELIGNTAYIPSTKHNARFLASLGYDFDKSAEVFLPKKYNLPDELFPYQKEGVEKALNMTTNILLADEMGLGKTPQACVYLKYKQHSLPALVISPATMKEKWQEELKKWAGINSYIIEGRQPQFYSKEFLDKYPVFIVNYDILGFEDKDERKAENARLREAKEQGLKTRKKILPVYGWCDEFVKFGFKTIIADEVQYIAETDTMRSRAVKQICSELATSKKLFISGTPYETKTSQFFSALNILDRKNFPSKWKFLKRYCNPIKTYYGWTFNGLTNAKELHELVSRIMIRRYKADVLSQLPPKIRSVVPLTVSASDRAKYDNIDWQFEQDIINGKKIKKDQIGHLSHLRQGAYEAKKKAVISWIKEYLELTDNKLVVFIYHHSTYNSLMDEFGSISVGLTGETPVKERQKIVDKYKKKKKIKLFIGQIKASGVGITLTEAPATCFVEFGQSWVQHEQAEDRVHRIGQKADSVMAYYLVLNNSIEIDIMSALNSKNKDIKKVLNNEDAENLFNADDFNNNILSQYKLRKNLKL